MNILYLSQLATNKDTGLYWSVPNQVKSQSMFDNVLWVNAHDATCEYWEKTEKFLIAPSGKDTELKELPEPFNNPDLVIFEGFYEDTRAMYREVRKYNIPYIIVPRCSLTDEAQKKHRLKKIIGNIYFFRRFAKNALAIQYLTENEYQSSGTKWNKNNFVMPNGVVEISEKQWQPKLYTHSAKLKGIFIGRISVYHKGLDILTDAVSNTREKLRGRGVTIDIYGPDRENERETLKKNISNQGISDILIVHDNSIFGEEKERLILESDFFVLTSRLEGHPMGLIEALSYGLPSLVTKGSNMYDEISSEECGWVSENNVAGIENSLKKLVSTTNDSLTRMSDNAIRLAKKYSWAGIAEKTHLIYADLLKQIY